MKAQMKTLAMGLVGATIMLTVAGPGEAAMVKCPQPNGAVLSMPESVGCSTPLELRHQEAEQAAASAERNSEAFAKASEACTRQVRYGSGGDSQFKSVARSDGTGRMVGTPGDQFEYASCMEKRGHRLNLK